MTQIITKKAPGACDTEGFCIDTNKLDSATSGALGKACITPPIVPSPDKNALLATLAALFSSGDVIELRAIHKGRRRIDAGYFDSDHWGTLADEAARLSASGAAVYITLNPVDSQLLCRYSNRVESFAAFTTTDKQVIRRRWLLIDLDPVRPSGTSATDTQLEAARIKAREVYVYLVGIGWSLPVVARSGNGYHLLFAVDLPNDDISTAMVKAVLVGLGERFDDVQTKVDRSVFNASRVCKYYGTVANKGDHTAAAPWRLSSIVLTPARGVVTAEQLAQLHTAVVPSDTRAVANEPTTRTAGSFNLENFLTLHGMAYTADQHDGRERFKLACCPFNSEHSYGEAAVFRKPSGELGFKCQHDSCASKGWREVRGLLDGSRTDATNPIESDEKYTVDSEQLDTWPVPTRLPDALPPVMAFNYALLPDSLRPWVADIAERMQCPPDFLAVGAMVAISGLVGARVVIQPKARDNWLVTPNLWGVIVGRPGAMKSPALNEVLKPLKRIEAKKREAYEAQCGEWEVSQRLRKLQDAASETKAKATLKKYGDVEAARELLRAADLEAEPIPERLIVNDTTVEALAEIMRVNTWGVLVERDELFGLLKSMDREGKEEDRSFYLTAYDGDKSKSVDRIVRGLNMFVPRMCAAMIGGIQPGRLSEYVRGAVGGGAADDGLIQRFQLAVWPDSSPEWLNVDRWPDTPARHAANAVFDRLEALPTPEGEAPIWRFDDAAQALFTGWRTELELRLRSETLHPVMEAHLSKNRKTIPAMALLFALIDTPDAMQVCEPELIRALGWASYLETHATRMYAAGIKPEAEGAALLLKRIKSGSLADKNGVIAETFTTRDVYRRGWQGLVDVDAVRSAANMLVEYDWLRREIVPGSAAGGRPSEQYRINPVAFGGEASGTIRKPYRQN